MWFIDTYRYTITTIICKNSLRKIRKGIRKHMKLCTHYFVRLCLTPQPSWGQKPLMLIQRTEGYLLNLKFLSTFKLLKNKKGDFMEIKIRNINANTIQRIDEIAKEKGLSRQEFLKNYIETLSVIGAIKESETKYVDLVNQLSFLIKENTNVLSQIRTDFILDEEK